MGRRYLSLFTLQFSLFTILAAQTPEPVDTAKVVASWPQCMQQRLDSLVADPLLEQTQLGLMVYDLSVDSAIYRYGSRQTLRPASTMKLVTAITALDLLGRDYHLRTSLLYQGKVKGHTLVGDVFLVGGMDPLFDETDMRVFVETLRRMEVDTISGRIVCDTSFKEENLLGEGWCWDDDNPQLSPLLISRKDEFATTFVGSLREAGVIVEAPITVGRVSKDALLVSSRSHKLMELLEPMMKESDNLYAEALFFQIAAATGQRPAKAVHARQAIKRLIAKTGFTGVPYRVADGSGLSLYNYVSPELMVSLLRYAYLQRDIISSLYPSLPIAGEDGTLKKRMAQPYLKGNVHAKTGTVSGISSLAGYCRTANDHVLAFCIINQGVMKASEGRAFQDKVCEIMCKP